MQVKIRIIALIALLGMIYSFPTRSVAEDFRSPRTQALGGAGHAAPLLNDAIYLNPSFASFLPTYSISANGDWYDYNNDAYSGRLWNASIQDGRSEAFQAGIGYSHFEQGTLVSLGASKAATKQLGFGLGSKVYFPMGGGDRVGDLTFSTEFVAKSWLQASFIADNLIQSSTAEPTALTSVTKARPSYKYSKTFLFAVDFTKTQKFRLYKLVATDMESARAG
jgi:hypothetical protein